MGASGSTPKTVPIDNPKSSNYSNPGNISVSIAVAQRISDAEKDFIVAQSTSSKTKWNEEQHLDINIPAHLLEKPAAVVEKEQFKKTTEDLDILYGKPIKFPEEDMKEISDMRKDLFSCYKKYQMESLRCHKLAQAFQSYVYKEQLDHIVKMKAAEQELKHSRVQDNLKNTPPGTCGAQKGSAGETQNPTGIKVSGDCRGPSDVSNEHHHDWVKN